MAAKTAMTMGRALRSSSSYLVLPKRLFSSSSSLTRSPHLPGFSRPVRSTVSLSHSLRVLAPAGAVRLNTIRCLVNPSGAVYSLLRYLGLVYDPPPRSSYISLSQGYDFEHWMVVVENPCGPGVTKQDIIDGYVETLAKVVGSKEEAQRRIYNISCDLYFGFGCEIDEETSEKLKGLPGVLHVLPDSYLDAENKDYGAELYVNGKIVKRSPEREKRVERIPESVREERSW